MCFNGVSVFGFLEGVEDDLFEDLKVVPHYITSLWLLIGFFFFFFFIVVRVASASDSVQPLE